MKLTAELKFIGWALLATVFVLPAHSAFEPSPIGGRAAGMGEAYSAVVDDIFSLYYNPSGIMQLERPEIGSYYSQLYPGLTDNSQISRMFMGYAQPLKNGRKTGSIGISYSALSLSGLYKEETMGFTYGREYHHLWNIGGTLKLLRKQIGSDIYSSNAIDPTSGNATGSADPLLAGSKSANAVALDLGTQYRLTQVYALGLTIKNVNQPNVALSGGSDTAPRVVNAAIARRLRNGSLDVEVSNFKTATNNTRFSIGGEHWFKNGFGLRAGGGLGSRSYSTVSFGASYKMESIQFDYATVLPLQGIQGTLGLQQISLIVRLGKPPVDPIEQQLIKEKEQRLKAETEARLAIAERDRLKNQLILLTEAKSKEKQQEEEESARRALEEAKQQAADREQASQKQLSDTDETKIFNDYTSALANYNAKVQQGIGLEEKKKILESILAKFGETKINTSTLKRELKSLQVEESRAKKDFDLSMNFYQRLVQQGASTEDRRGMLQRIIQKYQGTGIDIKDAENELRKLK